MEGTPTGHRFADRSKRSALKRVVRGRGSCHCGFPKAQSLPLDDCLYALQPTIPHLTRSSLHRCLQRHGISRLPETEDDKPARKKFKHYLIGYFHIDIAEVKTAKGRLYLIMAIDRISKFAYVELHPSAGKIKAAEFLRRLVQALPYAIHTVLTDNGIQFTNRKKDKYAFEHIFGRTCREFSTEHRLTQVKRPWTNGQAERMSRTIKEATVNRYHYDNHQQLESHINLQQTTPNLTDILSKSVTVRLGVVCYSLCHDDL